MYYPPLSQTSSSRLIFQLKFSILLMSLLALISSAATIFCEKISSSQISYICETMTVGEPDVMFQSWSSSGGIALTSPNTGPIVTAACVMGETGGTITTAITYVDSTSEQINKGLSCQQNTPCQQDCAPPPPPPEDPPEETEFSEFDS